MRHLSSTNTLLKKEMTHLVAFITNQKLFIFGSFLLVLSSYWAKIIYPNYSIDTEEFMIYAPDSGFIQWLAIGRYGLFLIKHFVTGYTINIPLINTLTYLLLFLTVVLLGYIFHRVLTTLTTIELLIIPLLFSSSAILLEQFNFILQSVEVSFSYFIVFLAVYLCYLATNSHKKQLYFWSCLLAIGSFSIYPSNYLAFIVFAIMIIISTITTQTEALTIKNHSTCITPYISVFLISVITDKLLLKFVLFLYKTSKGHYVESSVLWGKLPPKQILLQMYASIKSLYLIPTNPCFSYALTIGILLTIITLFTINKNRFWLSLSMFGLLVASNANIIVLGQLGPVRSMAPMIPLLTAFLFLFTIHNTTQKRVQIGLFLIILCFSSLQLKRTNQFALQEHTKFQEEVAYVQTIVAELKKQGINDLTDYQIAAIGSKHFPQKPPVFKGDALGASFFEWDNTTPTGSSGRIHSFFNSLGYPVKRIHEADYQQILQFEQAHPMAKDTVSIIDHTIILKLSE